MNDNKYNASASAEANLMKVSGNTVNLQIERSGKKPPRFLELIDGVKRIRNPAQYEAEAAEARLVRTQGVVVAYQYIKENMPWLTEEQALCMAHGYYFSPAQAENFIEVCASVVDRLPQEEQVERIDAETIDGFIEGSARAYDPETREIWARLIAGELEQPGRISKSARSILGNMEQQDALAFKKLCASVVYVQIEGKGMVPVIMQWHKGRGSKDILLTEDERERLRSLGIGDLFLKTLLRVDPHNCRDGMLVEIAGEKFLLFVSKEVSMPFYDAGLTRQGKELMQLCDVGTADGLARFWARELKKDGCKMYRVIGGDSFTGYEAEAEPVM